MNKKTIIPIAAVVLALAIVLGGLPLLSQLIYHRSLRATMLAWQFHKNTYTTVEAFGEYLDEKRAENAEVYELPESVDFTVPVVQNEYGGMRIFVLNGPGAPDGKVIVYFPGGSFIDEPSESHWRFLNALAEDTGCTVYVPIYPKLPEHDAAEAYKTLISWFSDQMRGMVCGELLFMGDSAGGGMALSLAMQLRDAGLPGPDRLILLSPWADVTMSNPAIPVYEKSDPVLDSEMLRQLGVLWAGGLEPDDPIVSPLYGDLSGLGEVWIFGTDGELLYPDLLALSTALTEAGTQIKEYMRPSLFHCWPAYAYMNIPESKQAYADIVSIIQTGEPLA